MFALSSHFFPSTFADFVVFLTEVIQNCFHFHGHSPILSFPLKILLALSPICYLDLPFQAPYNFFPSNLPFGILRFTLQKVKKYIKHKCTYDMNIVGFGNIMTFTPN